MSAIEWIETIIYMIASIGLLLVGFDLLSTNVTKLFHKGLKKLFNRTSKNKLIGVGVGAASTAIMQSSAATTIIIVGFVNSGLMDLFQATSIIMGANIGTTVTAQLAALSSFDFAAYIIVFAGIGVFIKMFAKKERTKTLGLMLSGLGLLFLGLMCMKEAVTNNATKEVISNVLANINGSFAPVILFLLGVILTALVQSSSLITTIIITLAGTGIYIGAGVGATSLNNNVLFLILGTNIGTCVTALISSIGASTNAKRASLIHLLFNTFGAIVYIIVFVCFNSFMEKTFGTWFSGHPETQLAMFHTFFNISCTILFLPFIKVFVKLSEILVKDNETSATLSYIDDRLLKSPSVAMHQTRRELVMMYDKAFDCLNTSIEGFFNRDVDIKDIVTKKNDEIIEMSKQVVEFLVKLSSVDLTYDDECTLAVFQKTIHDIMRIADIGDNVCKYTRRMVDEDLEFSDHVILQLGFMRSTIKTLYEKSSDVFLSKTISKLVDVDEVEEKIDTMRKQLVDDHFDRLSKGECKPQNSAVFVNLVNNLERAADHMTFIAHGVEEAYNQANLK